MPPLLAAPVAAVIALLSVAVPIAPYPKATPQPVGVNRLPSFVDDDELVLVQLAPDGSVRAMRSDIKLLVTGSSDFDITMPGPVLSVIDQGSDSPPALSDGRVQFLGHVEGSRLLSAEAGLDPAVYAPRLPMTIAVSYFQEGEQVDPEAMKGRAGTFREHISVRNLTARAQSFSSGQPDRAGLAQVLDAMRRAPDVYTPETDMQALFPLPPALEATTPVQEVTKDVYVPLSLVITAQLDANATVEQAAGADVSPDDRGTRLRWRTHLPEDTDADGALDLDFTYRTSGHRVPAVDFNITVVPLPPALFAPPEGTDWAAYLRAAPAAGLPGLAVRAQAAAAAFHRITDVQPPVNRPGGGPERVAYILTLDSGEVTPAEGPHPGPLHAEPWAVALLALASVVVAVNAWWAWSRH
ncbi:MAG: hypothetical protein QOE92_2601 [Chloroflexota bacterium]|nr:hypothetical protein [Chloroflexota bacterium]